MRITSYTNHDFFPGAKHTSTWTKAEFIFLGRWWNSWWFGTGNQQCLPQLYTCIIKAMVFPVVIYGCESWTIKKAEHWRIDAFELWCWKILLRDPWTARRSNQSILKEINPEYSLKDRCWSWSSNTLATWCKQPTHWKRSWWWERLKTKRETDSRGWNG